MDAFGPKSASACFNRFTTSAAASASTFSTRVDGWRSPTSNRLRFLAAVAATSAGVGPDPPPPGPPPGNRQVLHVYGLAAIGSASSAHATAASSSVAAT